jgi:hypothetical protein
MIDADRSQQKNNEYAAIPHVKDSADESDKEIANSPAAKPISKQARGKECEEENGIRENH